MILKLIRIDMVNQNKLTIAQNFFAKLLFLSRNSNSSKIYIYFILFSINIFPLKDINYF